MKLGTRLIARSLCVTLFASLASLNISMNVYAQQETPPPPAAPRSPQIPKPVEKTFANGLRVIIVERANVPLVAASLVVRNGGEIDPPNLAGLADMTASLLTKGTEKRSAPDIAESIEALGGALESGARWDASTATLNVMSNRLAPAMEILADVVRRPTFKDEEIERLRAQYLDDLAVALGQPGTIARYVAQRVVFGSGPYAHPLSGTPESIQAIKREDILRLHQTYYRPDNAMLVMAGDICPAAAFKVAEQVFGDWKKPAAALAMNASMKQAKTGDAHAKPRVVVIDKPDAGQAAVVLTRQGISRTDKDYFSGVVANSVLSGYSGRLNQEIRIKRGLSYGAGSQLDVRREVGPFAASAQTKNESGAEVATLLSGELGRLATGQLPETELVPRKAVVIGGFGRALETAGGLVNQIASLALYGLSLEEINTYINRVQAVTATDVQRFAGGRLDVKGASIVIVGDAKQFLPALKKQFGDNVEVIPVSELNLNSASLRRG